MRTIITTNRWSFKGIVGDIEADSGLSCHYTFRAGGGSPAAQGLENKAFSRAGAAGPGGFTPNMGYQDLGHPPLAIRRGPGVPPLEIRGGMVLAREEPSPERLGQGRPAFDPGRGASGL